MFICPARPRELEKGEDVLCDRCGDLQREKKGEERKKESRGANPCEKGEEKGSFHYFRCVVEEGREEKRRINHDDDFWKGQHNSLTIASRKGKKGKRSHLEFVRRCLPADDDHGSKEKGIRKGGEKKSFRAIYFHGGSGGNGEGRKQQLRIRKSAEIRKKKRRETETGSCCEGIASLFRQEKKKGGVLFERLEMRRCHRKRKNAFPPHPRDRLKRSPTASIYTSNVLATGKKKRGRNGSLPEFRGGKTVSKDIVDPKEGEKELVWAITLNLITWY